jgi:rhodanese-related sulfurtransferase
MQTISKSQLKQLIDQQQDMTLIDVLPKESFQKQHIPGAINIQFKDNSNFLNEVLQHVALKDQRIVVYCLNTQCPLSKDAAQKLEGAGYTNVQAFEEGVEGWFGKSATSSSGQAAA